MVQNQILGHLVVALAGLIKMHKDIFVSWQDQLNWMESNASASGSTDYDQVRNEMMDGLRSTHGRYSSFDYEEIPEEKFLEFITWLETPEED